MLIFHVDVQHLGRDTYLRMVRTVGLGWFGFDCVVLGKAGLAWIGFGWVGLGGMVGLEWVGLDWAGVDRVGLGWIPYEVGGQCPMGWATWMLQRQSCRWGRL